MGGSTGHGDQRPLLVNMYGITKTCVHVTWKIIKRSDVEANIGSIIGLPIPDLHIYLLDSHGQLVPFGVPGEIYVGGPGLAKGYLNRPELTGSAFFPTRFGRDNACIVLAISRAECPMASWNILDE